MSGAGSSSSWRGDVRGRIREMSKYLDPERTHVLALYRLIVRFGSTPDVEAVAARLAGLEESLRRADEEVEGRLSRGLVQVEDARDALRTQLGEARRAAEGARAGPLHV